MIEKKYAKIINEETHEVIIGVGVDEEYYKEIGMSEMDVELAYNGLWYEAGYTPVKPEPTVLEIKAEMRAIRDDYINDIEWRVSRYRDQKEMGVETSDTEEEYTKVLQYIQYLRDYPESGEDWYKAEPLTYKEWKKSLK